MSKRGLAGALMCGFFCMVLVFLAVGSASAACISQACVIEPGQGDILRWGTVSNIVVSIATDPFAFPVAKYKLFYTCLGHDFQVEVLGDGIGNDNGICEPDEVCKYNDSRWRLITTRSCNPYVGCPSTYPWSSVPYLPKLEVSGDSIGNDNGFCEANEVCTSQRTCAVRVDSLDMAGRRLDSGIGQPFTILPPGAAPAMYIRPLAKTVAAGGSAKYEVLGIAPYEVNVPDEHQPYITINGSSTFPVNVPDPTPLTPVVFTVGNTYSCGTSQEVAITVTDSIGATVSALYVIACP